VLVKTRKQKAESRRQKAKGRKQKAHAEHKKMKGRGKKEVRKRWAAGRRKDLTAFCIPPCVFYFLNAAFCLLPSANCL